MITIREYAAKQHISYEAVRKQLKRYSRELEGHLVKQNRTQFLDEYAVQFLDEKRKHNPVIVMEHSKSEELESVKQENEELKNRIIELQSMVMALQEEEVSLIEERGKNQLLVEMKEKSDKELEEMKVRLSEAEKEVQSYHRTVFGLYRKS